MWPDLGAQGPGAADKLRAHLPVAVDHRPEVDGKVVPVDIVRAQIAHTLSDLDQLASLSKGERLPWPGTPGGVGWDFGGLYMAERLVEASNSGAGYSLDEARSDFLQHSPPAEDSYNPEHKWSEALKHVGGRGLPYTPPSADFKPVSGEVHSGQIRMAYRLMAAAEGRLLYVYGVGWHCWDGKRWAEDNRAEAERAVVAVLRESIADSIGNNKLRSDVTRCESASGIRGVLAIAATFDSFAFTAGQMDADPFLVNCANGTLDLRDRQLRPHNPADHITKIACGAYDPEADQRVWKSFLDRVLPDAEERGYFRRVIGQACYGAVREHLFPVLTGTGANGKGTAYGALCTAFGDYATVINPDLLMVSRNTGGPEMMALRGARLVVASELGKDRVLDDSLMKRLTGGDQLTARHLFREPVTWAPTHQLLYVTNNKPATQGDDAAVWRRMKIIPFDVVIPEEERDLTLGETLALHADAVMTWAIEGFFDHEDNGGMREPTAVLKATAEYQHESDPLAMFLEEKCELRKDYVVLASELWQAWLTWSVEEGFSEKIYTRRSFGTALNVHGTRSEKGTGNATYRHGVRLAGEGLI